jgi:Peptidase M50B-like
VETLLAGLTASLDRVGQVQAQLPTMASVAMAILGILAVVVPGLLHAAVHIDTIAHEGAHATIGSALGHRVSHIDLKFNGAASTGIAPKSGSSMALFPSVFVGYLGPSAFGVGAAELIRYGHIIAVPWIGVIGLIPVLYLARRSLGIVIVIGAFAALVLLLGAGSEGLQVAAAYAIAWFLLISGVMSITKHGKKAADAGILKEMTGLPRGFWPPFWFVGAVAALIFGSTLLL